MTEDASGSLRRWGLIMAVSGVLGFTLNVARGSLTGTAASVATVVAVACLGIALWASFRAYRVARQR